jgi:hypothetical protein
LTILQIVLQAKLANNWKDTDDRHKVLTISQIVLQDRLANNWKDTDDGHKVLTISQIVLQDRFANNWKDTEDIEMLALILTFINWIDYVIQFIIRKCVIRCQML